MCWLEGQVLLMARPANGDIQGLWSQLHNLLIFHDESILNVGNSQHIKGKAFILHCIYFVMVFGDKWIKNKLVTQELILKVDVWVC